MAIQEHDGVIRSAFELIPRRELPRRKRAKFTSASGWAKLDFAPLPESHGGDKLVGVERLHECGISARLALGVVRKTKAELVETYKNLGEEATGAELIYHIAQASETFKEIAGMMDNAVNRLVVAGSVCEVAGRRAEGLKANRRRA